MTDVARVDTDLEVARGDVREIGALLTRAGIPETNSGGVPLHILYRVRIALGMEKAPE